MEMTGASKLTRRPRACRTAHSSWVGHREMFKWRSMVLMKQPFLDRRGSALLYRPNVAGIALGLPLSVNATVQIES